MCTYLQMLSITRYPQDLNLTFYLHDTNTTSTTSFPNKNNFLKPDVGASRGGGLPYETDGDARRLA